MEKIVLDNWSPANPPREKTLLGGAPYHAKFANVQETWRKYGWVPRCEMAKKEEQK